MNVGGYQIIDLKNKPFVGDGTNEYEFKGIYEKIEGTKKPLLVCGLNLEGKEYHNFFSMPKLSGTTYEIIVPYGTELATAISFVIKVTDNDIVSTHYRS